MLEDSAQIQDKNIKEENKRRKKQHLPARHPMYTVEEAAACIKLFTPIEYTKTIILNKNIEARFQDAGHIMGSASIELFVTEEGKKKKLVFSGDIGQRDTPIIEDPTTIQEADYLFMESTYGNRLHEDSSSKEELLTKHVTETFAK